MQELAHHEIYLGGRMLPWSVQLSCQSKHCWSYRSLALFPNLPDIGQIRHLKRPGNSQEERATYC